MKYQLTKAGDPTEALGAYSGYRIRLLAARDERSGKYAVRVFFRGSESLPENPVPVADTANTAEQALEIGYVRAVEWIDRLDGAEAQG